MQIMVQQKTTFMKKLSRTGCLNFWPGRVFAAPRFQLSQNFALGFVSPKSPAALSMALAIFVGDAWRHYSVPVLPLVDRAVLAQNTAEGHHVG